MVDLAMDKIQKIAAQLLDEAGISTKPKNVVILQGGNNRVCKLETRDASYLLKIYYQSDNEKHSRLLSEFTFLQYAWQVGVRMIPKPLAKDVVNHLGLYSFIDGRKLDAQEICWKHISDSLDFIQALNQYRGGREKRPGHIGMASDYSATCNEYIKAVDSRVKHLTKLDQDNELNRLAGDFVKSRLEPAWRLCKKMMGDSDARYQNPRAENLVLSPSDFGFHNAIINDQGLFFIDFEYAGWDDPVKLVCDFFCQPQVPVPLSFLEDFANRMIRIIFPGYELMQNVGLLMPLFRIKWCCIMLNEFLKTVKTRRQFAFYDQDRREKQLKMTIQYFNRYVDR